MPCRPYRSGKRAPCDHGPCYEYPGACAAAVSPAFRATPRLRRTDARRPAAAEGIAVSITPGSPSGVSDGAASEADVAGLMRDHDGPLRAYLARRLRNRHEVDDYVQDVYVRVLSTRSTKKVESWRGFLLRIASNLLIDRNRRDTVRRRDDHIPVEAEGDLLDENGHSPERTLLAKEELATLSKALDGFDPRMRTVFLAVRIEGLSLREAGARVGIDDKAAARLVERAVALAARSLLTLDEGTP